MGLIWVLGEFRGSFGSWCANYGRRWNARWKGNGKPTAPFPVQGKMWLMGDHGDQKVSKRGLRSNTYLTGTLRDGTKTRNGRVGDAYRPGDMQCVGKVNRVVNEHGLLPRAMARGCPAFWESPREYAWCKDTGASATGCLGIEAMGIRIYIDYGLFRNYKQ
jgi:hypothetical protein